MIVEFPGRVAWYALHVKPNSEFRVEDRLGRAGLQTYLPTQIKKGSRREYRHKAIPGYIFVRCAFAELRQVQQISQVITVLGEGSGPSPVPDDQVENLRMILTRPVLVIPLADLWHEGDEVEVVSGPLTGACGYVAYCKNQARLVVSIPLLGRMASTEVDPSCLKLRAPKLALAA